MLTHLPLKQESAAHNPEVTFISAVATHESGPDQSYELAQVSQDEHIQQLPLLKRMPHITLLEKGEVMSQAQEAKQRATSANGVSILAKLGQHLKHAPAHVHQTNILCKPDGAVAQRTEPAPLLPHGSEQRCLGSRQAANALSNAEDLILASGDRLR